MGSYAYIAGQEVKYSGHLGEVGRLNGFHPENSCLSLTFANVSYLVVELAVHLNRIDIQELTIQGDIQGLRRFARGLQDIESLLYWLDENGRSDRLNFC